MATVYAISEVVGKRIPATMKTRRILYILNMVKKISGVVDDPRRKGFRDRSVKSWLNRLEEVLCEMDDLLDEWDLATLNLQQQVCNCIPLSCTCSLISTKLVTRRDIAHKISELIAKLDLIFGEKGSSAFMIFGRAIDGFLERSLGSTSLVNMDSIYGRDVDRDILLRKIMVEGGNREGGSGVQVIPVVGLAGIGKTALAQLIYNDTWVMDYYPLRIWISVSNSLDLVRVVREIIQKVQQGNAPHASDWESVIETLQHSLLRKKYFLVLDDVWDGHYMGHDFKEILKMCLNCSERGSIILVTTRNERVARWMGKGEMYRLGQLSHESCWSILSDVALSTRNMDHLKELKDIGMEIAKKCNGVPHTAKVLGRLLRSKCSVEEWEDVMARQIWELEELSEEIFRPLLVTYHELPPFVRCCFSYCGIVPKGFLVYTKKLIRCWSAQGYLGSNRSAKDLEHIGQEYLKYFEMNSLFQDEVVESRQITMCKIHDIVHDCAHFLRKSAVDERIMATCQACSTSIISHVKTYRSLAFHKGPPTYICDCLKGLRVLSLRNCGLESIPKGMVILIHLRFLDLSYNQLCGEDLTNVCKLYELETLFLSSCGLQEIPKEIGDLLNLSHLDLSFNSYLSKLPESICNLLELRTLELDECWSLSELPQGIHRLTKLKHIHNLFTKHSCPLELGQLMWLQTLNEFSGKLSLLKQLNKLRGSLQIRIPESCGLEDVAEAKGAELYCKMFIDELEILFGEDINEAISTGILNALQPPLFLKYLNIELYSGSKLPSWIVSPSNCVRQIILQQCYYLMSLPALGRLPWLEELVVQEMDGLQCVGREFLGLTTEAGNSDVASSSSSDNDIGFPSLKVLIFYDCPNWDEWEDITAEDEESTNMTIMPYLKKLDVVSCGTLAALPQRLLQKAASLEELDMFDSSQLIEIFEDREGSDWDFISHIPQVRFD